MAARLRLRLLLSSPRFPWQWPLSTISNRTCCCCCCTKTSPPHLLSISHPPPLARLLPYAPPIYPPSLRVSLLSSSPSFDSNTDSSHSYSDDEYLEGDDSATPHNFFSQQATDVQSADSAREGDACEEVSYDQNNNGALMPFNDPTDIYFPVKAFFISRRIDLKNLEAEPFTGVISSRNSIIIKWKDRPPGSPPAPDKPGVPALATRSKSRYVVVFNYGSVVLFNFGEHEEEECLANMRRHCKEQCEEAKKDDFDVLVRPGLEEWSLRGHDKVILKTINKDNVRIISSILGQSIALDHYGRKVDEMVNIFGELNQGMEKTGTFTMTRKELFKVVAAANSTLADVILRIGILERSEAAWKDAKYAELWEILRDEFELDQRFTSFDFKLEIIQHNVRFFLEVLQNRKSAFLEWIIILLIAGEILVGLYQIFHDLGYW